MVDIRKIGKLGADTTPEKPNTLAVAFPEIASEWHPEKNGNLTPETVSYGSGYNAWWLLPYDDPVTGKHFDFEWQAKVLNRTINRTGCPFLFGHAVWAGYNDLATKNPELSAQWHPTKNGDISPQDVSIGSHFNAWWFYPYDDPTTGKHFNFEWQCLVSKRVSDNLGCPFLSGKATWPGYNDLMTRFPELCAEWHPTKNGELAPNKVSYGSGINAWWIFPYDDPVTGKHFVFEWQEKIATRTSMKTGCPFLSGHRVWKGFNDLATTDSELSAQWHPTKNGTITPDSITAGSKYHAWWLLPYNDPETGKHFDFVWCAEVKSRALLGRGCPFLNGSQVWRGYNDLATKKPDLASQWHPYKNVGITPEDVSVGSTYCAWWLLSYIDPSSGKSFIFEWQATVESRATYDAGCPFLTGRRVQEGFNDLLSTNPDIANQWHPYKNGSLKPTQITSKSGLLVWWFLSYDDPETGKHFDFEWQSKVCTRITYDTRCPFLSGQAVWPGYNDLLTKYPDIASEWHSVKNGTLTPSQVNKGSKKKVWWICPLGHEYPATISSRVNRHTGCPYCAGKKVTPENSLAQKNPELMKEWDFVNNYAICNPNEIGEGSCFTVWWNCQNDSSHKYPMLVNERVTLLHRSKTACPFCKGRRRKKNHYV